MERINRKLHGKQGSSMVIALLFFMICLTAGSLVLSAATADSVKTKDRYSSEQHYLAVASAARLLKAKMGSYSYTRGKTWQTWETGETNPETGGPVTVNGWKTIEPFLMPDDGEGGDLLTSSFEIILDKTGEEKRSFSITSQETPDVLTEYQMRPGGDAEFTLRSGDYRMKVSFTARTSKVTDYISYDYEITSWSEGIITKGES